MKMRNNIFQILLSLLEHTREWLAHYSRRQAHRRCDPRYGQRPRARLRGVYRKYVVGGGKGRIGGFVRPKRHKKSSLSEPTTRVRSDRDNFCLTDIVFSGRPDRNTRTMPFHFGKLITSKNRSNGLFSVAIVFSQR